MDERYQLEVEPTSVAYELESWIRDDKQSSDWRLEKKIHGERAHEHLGGLEIVEYIMGAGGAGAFFQSLNTWIKYRQPQAKITIKNKSGGEITVDATNSGDIQAIIRALRNDS